MTELEIGAIIGMHILFGYAFFVLAIHDAFAEGGLKIRIRGIIFSLLAGVLLINASLLSIGFVPETAYISTIIQLQAYFPLILFTIFFIEVMMELRKVAKT